jgi:hypothetical protein
VQVDPYQAPPISGSKPSSGKVSQAAPEPTPLETLADASPQSAPPQAAPSQPTKQAAPSALPSKAADQPASEAAQPQPAPQPTQSESVARSAATETSADELAVSIPPSPQASAAADAASADLKTLEEQIAANPPSGIASPPTAANRASAAGAEFMPPREYLGQTFDLFGDQNAAPQPMHQSPESIRRRARSKSLHYGHQ